MYKPIHVQITKYSSPVTSSVYEYILISLGCTWAYGSGFESNIDKLCSSDMTSIWNKAGDLGTQSWEDWMPAHKTTTLSRIKLKTWTVQPAPKMSEHTARLTPIPEKMVG